MYVFQGDILQIFFLVLTEISCGHVIQQMQKNWSCYGRMGDSYTEPTWLCHPHISSEEKHRDFRSLRNTVKNQWTREFLEFLGGKWLRLFCECQKVRKRLDSTLIVRKDPHLFIFILLMTSTRPGSWQVLSTFAICK